MSINETVLEMHFHRPIMDLFRDTFGVGKGGFNFYKYSPQKECFVGFDQAYVKTELSSNQFFDTLKHAALNNNYKLKETFIGYFLQFKVVSRLNKFMKYTPTAITTKPHYRVSLDTQKNMNTGVSQHELLYNLSKNAGAMVYYACPMVFERESLYEVDVDLGKLRLADLDTCPSAYSDNENHFIYYKNQDSEPFWCSDPVKGKAITPEELAKLLMSRSMEYTPRQSAQSLLKLLTDFQSLGISETADYLKGRKLPGFFEIEEKRDILDLVSDSLTIIKLTHQK